MVWTHTREAIQQIVDLAPKAKWYFSGGFDTYQWLWYQFGCHAVSTGKSETYSVEADNAELRHYLAMLARRSRCFSRCPYVLECALRVFIYSFNRRQLHRGLCPRYQTNVMDFISLHFSYSLLLLQNREVHVTVRIRLLKIVGHDPDDGDFRDVLKPLPGIIYSHFPKMSLFETDYPQTTSLLISRDLHTIDRDTGRFPAAGTAANGDATEACLFDQIHIFLFG